MRTTLISLHGRTPYTEDASGHYQILLLAFLAPGRFILFTAPADHVRNGSPQATKLPDIGLHGADSPTGYRGLRISAVLVSHPLSPAIQNLRPFARDHGAVKALLLP